MSHKLSKSFLFFRQNQGYHTPNVHDIHATISQARQLRSKKLFPLPFHIHHIDPAGRYQILEHSENGVDAHEYTHAIQISNHQSTNISSEIGALRESWSDIFGNVIEAWESGSGKDYIYRNYSYTDSLAFRDFSSPNTSGYHLTNPDSFETRVIGSPDTYEGLYWAPLNAVNNSDIYTNASVQNHWFYLLTNGGAGHNDNNQQYTVWAIDDIKAEKITYYTMMLTSNTGGYIQARDISIIMASSLYGECSEEMFETARAWHAVGVGTPIDCEGLGVPNETNSTLVELYPNPSSDRVTFSIPSNDVFNLNIWTINGTKVRSLQVEDGSAVGQDGLSNGVYIFELSN